MRLTFKRLKWVIVSNKVKYPEITLIVNEGPLDLTPIEKQRKNTHIKTRLFRNNSGDESESLKQRCFQD